MSLFLGDKMVAQNLFRNRLDEFSLVGRTLHFVPRTLLEDFKLALVAEINLHRQSGRGWE